MPDCYILDDEGYYDCDCDLAQHEWCDAYYKRLNEEEHAKLESKQEDISSGENQTRP